MRQQLFLQKLLKESLDITCIASLLLPQAQKRSICTGIGVVIVMFTNSNGSEDLQHQILSHSLIESSR